MKVSVVPTVGTSKVGLFPADIFKAEPVLLMTAVWLHENFEGALILDQFLQTDTTFSNLHRSLRLNRLLWCRHQSSALLWAFRAATHD